MRTIDRTGQRFGRLVIQSQYSVKPEGAKRSRTRCLCLCDCGNTIDTMLDTVVDGRTTSCGCFWLERVSTHGMTNHPLFVTWRNMMLRCHDPNSDGYANYGARGIVVCERWHDIHNFVADMGMKPSESHSIDRIDVDGPYSPDNCRWATAKEQGRNKRKKIEINGEAHGVTEWCEKLDVNRVTYWSRRGRGLSPVDALTKPKGQDLVLTPDVAIEIRQRYDSDSTLSVHDLAQEYGVSRGTIHNILHSLHPHVQHLPPIKMGRGKHRGKYITKT